MDRALGHSFQLRKYHEIIHPICHIVSSHGDFGIQGLQASIEQSFEEAPTRKIVRKLNKVYHMLEDKYNVPTIEEQTRYRDLIRYEREEYIKKRMLEKGSDVQKLESDIYTNNAG